MRNPLERHLPVRGRVRILLLAVMAFCLGSACQSQNGEAAGQTEAQPAPGQSPVGASGAPYDFARPDAQFKLFNRKI